MPEKQWRPLLLYLQTRSSVLPLKEALLQAQTYSFIILTEPISSVHIHVLCDTSVPKQFTEVHEINNHLTLLYIIVLPTVANQ